jgi:8-oxo-dGTP diphosphatase
VTQIKVAVKGILIKNQKMLIVQRSKNDETGAGTWESVGGILHFGESFDNALKREFFEEVGLSIQVQKLLFSTTFLSNPARQIVLLTFLCTSEEENITLSDEHDQYLWANNEELLQLLPRTIIKDYEMHGIFELIGR